MLVVKEKPNSIDSERYRILRTNIEYSSYDHKIKTIVVTSSEVGEGKSTTASNLAISFAQIGKKTILIDCDLRKPSIHKLFEVSNIKGLSEALIGDKELDECIYSFNENLDILTSGHIPPNPSEMISSIRMEKLLKELSLSYDYIIVDSAPIQAVTDAQILSVKADGTIMVVRAEKTKKDSILSSKNLLEKVGANIIGIVLNGIENKNKEYYYYYGANGEKKSKRKKSKK